MCNYPKKIIAAILLASHLLMSCGNSPTHKKKMVPNHQEDIDQQQEINNPENPNASQKSVDPPMPSNNQEQAQNPETSQESFLRQQEEEIPVEQVDDKLFKGNNINLGKTPASFESSAAWPISQEGARSLIQGVAEIWHLSKERERLDEYAKACQRSSEQWRANIKREIVGLGREIASLGFTLSSYSRQLAEYHNSLAEVEIATTRARSNELMNNLQADLNQVKIERKEKEKQAQEEAKIEEERNRKVKEAHLQALEKHRLAAQQAEKRFDFPFLRQR